MLVLSLILAVTLVQVLELVVVVVVAVVVAVVVVVYWWWWVVVVSDGVCVCGVR